MSLESRQGYWDDFKRVKEVGFIEFFFLVYCLDCFGFFFLRKDCFINNIEYFLSLLGNLDVGQVRKV